jgi:serine protease Do
VDELLDAIYRDSSLIPRLGILAVDLNRELSSQLNPRIASGVVVVGRAADLILPDTGLQAGDVIHQLNTTPIDSTDTLRAAVRQLKTGDPVVLQVERADGLTFVSFEME